MRRLVLFSAISALSCSKLSRLWETPVHSRMVEIEWEWLGASAEDVERGISRPVEAALASTPDLRRVETWSCPGGAVALATLETAVLDARDPVSRSLRDVDTQLPEEVGPGLMVPAHAVPEHPCFRFGLPIEADRSGFQPDQIRQLRISGQDPDSVREAAEGLIHSLEGAGLVVEDGPLPTASYRVNMLPGWFMTVRGPATTDELPEMVASHPFPPGVQAQLED